MTKDKSLLKRLESKLGLDEKLSICKELQGLGYLIRFKLTKVRQLNNRRVCSLLILPEYEGETTFFAGTMLYYQPNNTRWYSTPDSRGYTMVGLKQVLLATLN